MEKTQRLNETAALTEALCAWRLLAIKGLRLDVDWYTLSTVHSWEVTTFLREVSQGPDASMDWTGCPDAPDDLWTRY
jgi:hypothetical protein